MNYRQQVLKDVAQGKFSKKSYTDLTKKKNGSNPKLFVNKSYAIANEELDKFNNVVGDATNSLHSPKEDVDIDFETEEASVNPIQVGLYTHKYEEDANKPESIINKIDEDTNQLISDKVPSMEPKTIISETNSVKSTDSDKKERISKIVRTTKKSIKTAMAEINQKKSLSLKNISNRKKKPESDSKTLSDPSSPMNDISSSSKKSPINSENANTIIQIDNSPGSELFTETNLSDTKPKEKKSINDDILSDKNEQKKENIIIKQLETKVSTLENQITELEDYIVEMAVEIEKLMDTQQKIVKVINKLSADITLTKNKIAR
jgi:hypothetical protein